MLSPTCTGDQGQHHETCSGLHCVSVLVLSFTGQQMAWAVLCAGCVERVAENRIQKVMRRRRQCAWKACGGVPSGLAMIWTVHQRRGAVTKPLLLPTGSCSQFYNGADTVHEYNSAVKQL